MAEGTYEYECMRAELLGIEKPDYEEFIKKKKEQEQHEVKNEEVDIENIKEIDIEGEQGGRIVGKLDELNTILKKTQTKISKMKVTCGSVAERIKTRFGSFSQQSSIDAESEDHSAAANVEENNISSTDTTQENPTSSENGTPIRKSDLAKALDTDLSKLDAMLEKAETAQYSMAYQSKEMKKFLK